MRPAEELNTGALSLWVSAPGGSRTALTWTPDGRWLIFVGRRGGVQQLYVRALNAAEARSLPGTEGAGVPAVSADGRWVAVWAAKALKKVSLGGGPVMELASAIDWPPSGLVWDGSGAVFFGKESGGIWRIPAGGAPTSVTTLGEDRAHIPSSVLPGDRALLYTVRKRQWSWGDEDVVALDLATGQRTALLQDAADARYVPTGHLLFLRRGVLFAVALDVGRLKVVGQPVPVLDGVAQALGGWNSGDINGTGQFTIAASGSLAWIPGAVVDSVLVTVDRHGRVSALGSPARIYGPSVRVSPDGSRLATTIQTLTEVGLWLYDLRRRTLTPMQRSGEATWPVWSPGGQHVVFQWLEEGRYSLACQRADGSASPAILANANFSPSSWAPGGRLLSVVGVAGELDVAVATPGQRPGRIEPLLQTAAIEQSPEISPGGRWLVYGSNASGRDDIYIEPYPGGGARTLVVDGGSPAWHPSGRELFYVTSRGPVGNQHMMAVDFAPGAPPRIGTPRRLFEFDLSHLAFGRIPVRCYDVSPDGQRFYVLQTPTPPPPSVVTHINLVLNWFEELKAKVPITK